MRDKISCSTIIYRPLMNHILQIHMLREFLADISYEITANNPSGRSKKKYGLSSLCQHGNSRLIL